MATTARDIVTAALQEMGALAQGETASAADADVAFKRLNRMLDTWNADKLYVYTTRLDLFTLTPALSPHTIGPTGATFVYAGARPEQVLSAGLIVSSGPPAVRIPIVTRDATWWANQTVKALSTDVPTDMYYDSAWPLGKLFFWPVPASAKQVELETVTRLEKLATLDTAFSLPPGYEDAVTLSLAEALGPAFGRGIDPELARQAREARVIVRSANAKTPRISTSDAGVPREGSRRPDFHYLTGKVG